MATKLGPGPAPYEEEGVLPIMPGRRPDPDPTLRSVQMVDRAINGLRDEMLTHIDAITVRFEAIDRATQIVHEDYVRVPTVVDKAVLSLKDLIEAKLHCHDDLTLAYIERIKKLEENYQHRPFEIRAEVNNLKEFVQEKEKDGICRAKR